MGRPLDKRAFGAFTITSCWIPGDNSASSNATIVSQIGMNRYIAASTVNVGKTGVVQLQKANVTAAGQAQIVVTPFNAVPSGSGASVTVSSMQVNGATVVSGGTGYTNGQVLTVATGTSTTSAATITVTVSGGVVTGVTGTTPGNYTTLPDAPTGVTGGGGTGATFTLTYKVGGLTVSAGGSGYTHGATLALGGNATGTLTVSGNAITGATLTSPGSGYQSPPTATVTGGATGTTETARTIWYHRVNTWEGNQYVFNSAGTSPNASYAAV